MSEPAMLADHLDRQTDAILAVWRTIVERVGDVSEAGRLSYAEFVDHVPQILDRLAERLRGRPADPTVVAKQHGQIRWRQGYDIAEVVNEFGHLRTTLTRATLDFARQNHWDLAQAEEAIEAINDILDECTAESVRQFQDDSRNETQSALAEVKQRQSAIEDAWIAAKLEKAKLRTILGSLPVAVWVVDGDGTIIGVNDEAVRLQGLTLREDVGRVNVLDPGREPKVFRPDGSPFPRDGLPIVRALKGETVTQEELIWVTPDGGTRTVLVKAAPLTDAHAKILGAVAAVQDISGRKQLEARLAASEAQFRSIAEKLPVMIWRSDVQGHYDYVNQTWLDFHGPAHEDSGEHWPKGIHPDDLERCLAVYRQALDRREPFELTYRRRRADGQYRWISDRATPYDDSHGKFLGYLGSCLDITDRIDLETALERQREIAEEASRHKTRLVSALSHDARTPLNAVVLAAQLLEIHFDGGQDDEVQSCLRTIRHSVRNVLDLLGDLLDLSKIDAGALPPEVSRFPLELVLTECLASIEPQAHLKRLDVRLEPGGLAGKSLETDRSKFKQILSNLLSNALRYTEKGHIRVYGELSADQIRIAVEDTGIGIDPSDQGRIFDEFAVLGDHQHTEGRTGLGLAICRRLAGLLKGEITLRSVPGQGSTFTLILPSAVLTLNTPAAGGGVAFETPGAEQGAIVVAEDHPDSRQTLSRVLRRMGYRVLEASNGREVLALARQERLLAVLMDVNMPVMDGIEATLLLRNDPRHKDLPIFALTGDVTLVNQHRIGEAGVNGYLEKPVTWDALKQALGSVTSRPAVG